MLSIQIQFICIKIFFSTRYQSPSVTNSDATFKFLYFEYKRDFVRLRKEVFCHNSRQWQTAYLSVGMQILQQQEGWKFKPLPSSVIHWTLQQGQLRRSTDNSDTALCNHLCLCRLCYGVVCKIQWSRATRLDDPGSPVSTLVLSFCVLWGFFGGRGDGRGFQWKGWWPIEVKHVTSAKEMHM